MAPYLKIALVKMIYSTDPIPESESAKSGSETMAATTLASPEKLLPWLRIHPQPIIDRIMAGLV